MESLDWATEKRKVSELVGLSINPRKISEHKKKILIESINKFNIAEIPAINKDGTIISGHQRIEVLKLLGRGDEFIDVRVPNRKLTKKEVKEYNVISNTHAGEWDFEIMEAEFADIEVEKWGVDMPIIFDSIEDDKFFEPKVQNIKEKSFSHVLISYPKEEEEVVRELLGHFEKSVKGVNLDYSKR